MIDAQRLMIPVRHQAAGDDWQATVELDHLNQRLKLKTYHYSGQTGLAALGEHLLALARSQGLGKVLAESREADWPHFLSRGFTLEGMLPGMLNGQTGYLMSYFVDPARQQSTRLEQENEILEAVLFSEPAPGEVDGRFERLAPSDGDLHEMAHLFRLTFDTYPTPLDQPDYLAKLMAREEALFRIVRDGSRLISAGAAEVDWNLGNAELTNCATLPQYRGAGLMSAILADLEGELTGRGIGCLFSLARASSHGMNLVLHRLGYTYQGRLLNNCHICGDWEDMNLWVKV